MWSLMTEVFEFGMGLIAGDSWSRLLYAYNIFAGWGHICSADMFRKGDADRY